ncbi:MAG: hypothetical protein ACLFVJ_00090 [Persicimonas sp.]
MTDAVLHHLRLSVPLLLLSLALSGCQTMRGVLKPYVCDCSAETASQSCPTDREDQPPTAVALSQQQTERAVSRAREKALPDSDDAPSLRKIERAEKKMKEPKVDPMKVADPEVEEARVDLSGADESDRLQDSFGIELPDEGDGFAFTGNFTPNAGRELAVVHAGRDLAFYGSDGRIAHLPLDIEWDASTFEELELDSGRTTPRAVRLVRDGTLQILLHWREEDDEGHVAYKVGAFKVIGAFVGRIFEETLATREAPDGELRRRGTYEFLHGKSHHYVRWIPADDAGDLLIDQAEVLQWNRWEGVYRVPEPPPTAPRRDKLQTRLDGGLLSDPGDPGPNDLATLRSPARARLAQSRLDDLP